MNYGFVIDTRSCIGCHACSTACKSENDVPLGVNRTWVKYTEQGRFPDVKRSFQVTRCNHCANPPCVTICPVSAMYQRKDGIVEFNGDACIGCKGCLQACPYDAIYIDPDSGTAAKCHFCGHRIEAGLEPACVVVCPTHAILAGDIDNPDTEIARALAKHPVTVRKPEQGTAPKLFYIEGNAVSLHPTALPREPAGTMMTDVLDAHGHNASPGYDVAAKYEVKLRFGDDVLTPPPRAQGLPSGGPITVAAGRFAGQMTAQVAHTAWHKVPWHWQVPAYLVTKALGAGALLAWSVLTLSGLPLAAGLGAALAAVGLLGLVTTTALLVGDLERPERFLRILTRPQWKSWLTRGAVLLIALSATGTLTLAQAVATDRGWMPALPALATGLAVTNVPLALGVAAYTAFLFGQCEGRDLWQSALLPLQFAVRAAVAGAAVLCALSVPFAMPAYVSHVPLLVALGANLALLLGGEFAMPHATELAARAARMITHGKYRRHFVAALGVGHLLPMLLAFRGTDATRIECLLAAAAALVGLYLYEYAFVMAPQELPNS